MTAALCELPRKPRGVLDREGRDHPQFAVGSTEAGRRECARVTLYPGAGPAAGAWSPRELGFERNAGLHPLPSESFAHAAAESRAHLGRAGPTRRLAAEGPERMAPWSLPTRREMWSGVPTSHQAKPGGREPSRAPGRAPPAAPRGREARRHSADRLLSVGARACGPFRKPAGACGAPVCGSHGRRTSRRCLGG